MQRLCALEAEVPKLIVKEILPDGHEGLSQAALLYMKSMADRHGFILLEPGEPQPGVPVRIEINYPLLRDRIFLALLEDLPPANP